MTQSPAMPSSWSDLRRRVARIGASLDVVVRSDPKCVGSVGLAITSLFITVVTGIAPWAS